MYLRKVHIEHTGPIRGATFELPTSSDGFPQPVVLVGENGSGKTTFLSLIADALFEVASTYYTDIVPQQSGLSRPWFRIVGTSTSVGAQGGCAVLEFESEGQVFHYREKAGTLASSEVRERAPESMHPAISWSEVGPDKGANIQPEVARRVFREDVCVYFPSSRSEVPHWLNRKSLPPEDFQIDLRSQTELRKPIYVDRGLDDLRRWLLSLLIDVRVDYQMVQGSTAEIPVVVSNIDFARSQRAIWGRVNRILKIILGDENARFVWMGRSSPGGIGIEHQGVAISMDALSAGQATLLSVFGTLLRYGDSHALATAQGEFSGVCAIDEIDAHMHVDLQFRALPQLVSMFRHMQFIVSSHSPLFVLGMKKLLGSDGFLIVDMPSGMIIQAEAYSEFGKALEVIQETKAFNQAMSALAQEPGRLLVLVEGETDPRYLEAAAELLGFGGLLSRVEFNWIGAKDPRNGQGFHTGKDALNATFNFLKAKPDLVRRPVVLLYDNDAGKTDVDQGYLHVRSLGSNQGNEVIRAGIENLLPSISISPDCFDERTVNKPNGTILTTKTLNKARLCTLICDEKRDASDFEGFRDVLNMLDRLA